VSQKIISATAGGTLTDKEGYFVKQSSGTVVIVSGATDRPAGVLVSGAASGSECDLALPGEIALVKLNGTVAKHQEIQVEADGSVIANAGSGGRVIVGQMLEAGVSGDLKRALIYEPEPAS
jgi:hypothetical protein